MESSSKDAEVIKNSDTIEKSVVMEEVDQEIDESNGRVDDFGNYVKNLEDLPEVLIKLAKFNEEKRVSPNAVVLTFKDDDYDAKFDRKDVYACLKLLKADFSSVRSIYRCGGRSFTIDFNNGTWKKYVISQINKFYSDKFKVHSEVQDVTKVTVGGLPVHISDSDVLEFLKIFGDFSDDLDDVIHKFDENGAHMGERVYSASKIAIDIPSFWWLYGHQVSFKYVCQPQTCRLCGRRGHRAFHCPGHVLNQRGRSTPVEIVISSDVTAKDPVTPVMQNGPSNKSYAGRVVGETPSPQPTKIGSQGLPLKKSWSDGGFVPPGGLRPQYVKPVGEGGGKRAPLNATLGDFMPNGPREKMVRLKNKGPGKYRKVVIAEKKLTEEEEKLVSGVNEKIMEVQRIVGDDMFSEDGDEKQVAVKVHKLMVDVKNMVDRNTEEPYQHPVDGSPEAIRKLIEYDLQLLTNCSKRIGAPCGTRLKSPAFRRMIDDFVGGLESRKRVASDEIKNSSDDSG